LSAGLERRFDAAREDHFSSCDVRRKEVHFVLYQVKGGDSDKESRGAQTCRLPSVVKCQFR